MGAQCPGGAATCATSDACGTGTYCSNGCCVGVIQ
jgi:hypothetical protein